MKLRAEDKIAAASRNATKLDKGITAYAKHQIQFRANFQNPRIKSQRDRTLDNFDDIGDSIRLETPK